MIFRKDHKEHLLLVSCSFVSPPKNQFQTTSFSKLKKQTIPTKRLKINLFALCHATGEYKSTYLQSFLRSAFLCRNVTLLFTAKEEFVASCEVPRKDCLARSWRKRTSCLVGERNSPDEKHSVIV